jgi:hypothetical protein
MPLSASKTNVFGGNAVYVYPFVDVAVPALTFATTSTAPAACAGVVTVIVVDVLPVIVAAVPPNVTDVAPLRLVPVITTPVCPPPTGPLFGTMLLIVGVAGAVYVYPFVEVAVPALTFATTSTAPAACAGVVTVIVVDVFPVIVAAVPPNVTDVAPLKFVPVITTPVCPPATGPLFGTTLVIVGPAIYV